MTRNFIMLWGIGAVLLALQPASAEVRLPHLLSDNMVLQRDLPIPIWGWAKPVAVRFGWRQDADPNLMNKEGLPAPCFRTDKLGK